MTTTHSETVLSDAVINSRVNYSNILDELVIRMRNNLTDRKSRTIYITENFTGDGTTTNFTFTQDLDSASRHTIKNVKSVKINGVEKTYLTDYLVGYRKSSPFYGKIKFTVAPAVSDSITVYYGKSYSMVFSESPRVDLTVENYPRVNIEIQSSDSRDMCIGGGVTRHTLRIMFTITDITRDNTEKLTQEIKDYFVNVNNKKSFKTFNYIRNPRITPLIPNGEDPNDVVYICQVECEIPQEYDMNV